MLAPIIGRSADEIERLILLVRGVEGARVVQGNDGQIDEIHVLATPERTPKSIVRDIETVLLLRGGVRVNYRKISLVQLDGSLTLASRIQLVRVSQTRTDEQTAVAVQLTAGRREVSGEASAPGDAAPLIPLAGRATVTALAQLVGQEVSLNVEHVALQPFGELAVCLAHVSLARSDSVEQLVGISIARDDALAAAARAVLDATNRRLPSLLTPQGAL